MHASKEPDGQPFREFVEVLRALVVRANSVIDAARPHIVAALIGTNARLASASSWLAEHGPMLAASAAALVKLAAESHVENWKTLDEDQWVVALDLMRADDGVPLAWTPPAHVVEALVDAGDYEARDAVLLTYANEIEQHARELLDAVNHAELLTLRDAVLQGWEAWAADLPVPAQSAAGVAVGDILLKHGFDAFGDFRKKWEPFRDTPVEEWQLTELRTTALMCALSTAVQREDQGTFPGFNRNASLHEFSDAQHTPANALRGLMLVTAAARELQFEKTAEWMHGSGFTMPRMNHDPADPAKFLADSQALQERVSSLHPPKGYSQLEAPEFTVRKSAFTPLGDTPGMASADAPAAALRKSSFAEDGAAADDRPAS